MSAALDFDDAPDLALYGLARSPSKRPRIAPRPVIRARTRRRTGELGEVVLIDGRTRPGRQVAALRARLVAHVGGSPSGAQVALIERCCQLGLRLIGMDAEFAATGAMSPHASRAYLAWSNSFVRAIAALGPNPAPKPVESLADILREHAAERSAGAASVSPATIVAPVVEAPPAAPSVPAASVPEVGGAG